MNHQENGQDSARLQAIFERFETPLVRYAARLVGSTERGRDVVQDVFLQLCRQGSKDEGDRIAAWLYTVCRNRALDVCKKEQRMSSLHSVSSNGKSSSSSTADPARVVLSDPAALNPAMAAERKDDATQAQTMLERLPENQQEVIRLKIEHGLKYRQISEVTGLSVSNVGYLLHQGLKTLRLQIDRQHAE